jgi:hypothetical protein
MNRSDNTAAVALSAADAVPARTRSPRRTFVLHVAEMLLVMFVGMGVFSGLLAAALALAGTSMMDASIEVHTLVMGFNMTLPMVLWMRYRGHGARDNAEMAGSMIVSTLAAIALSLVGVLAEDSVMLVQHVVMIPAMIGVMLWRYDHYAH